jgi:hypothetical protein
LPWSAVDCGNVRLVVALAAGGGEIVEPSDLLRAQLDAVGGGVLLDAGDALGPGDRGDVVSLREQPGQSDLRRCGVDLGGDGLDLVDDAEVLLEVASVKGGLVLRQSSSASSSGERIVPVRKPCPSGE